MGGKGRYEVLIIFENNGDTALQDVCINDVLPSNFELKDWIVRGEGGNKRDDVTIESTTGENGYENVWSIPVVEKGERLEVSFEIKGEGEVDAEVLNQFHGVTFGDEVEDDMPAAEEPTEEASSDESTESSDEPGAGFKWREDVLLRVMAANGIDESHRDDFVRHAVKFDDDDNQYLKKAEIEAAAAAWGSANESADSEEVEAAEETEAADESASEESEEAPAEEEAAAEDAPAEEEAEATEESNVEETPTEESSTKDCPICGKANPEGAVTCESCGFAF